MQSTLAIPPPLPRATQGLRSATFQERGACVAFTTPFLVSARVRPAPRGRMELVVANASGGPGVYITSWDGVQSLCCPTLHDRRLSRKLETLAVASPAALRRIALDVAAEGLAGRPAAAAAAAARTQAEQERLTLNIALLVEVIRTVEQRERGWSPPDLAAPAALERRALAALAVLAPHVGRPAEQLFGIIETIAACFAELGIGFGCGPAATGARLRALIAEVEALPRAMGEWPFARGEDGVLDTVLVHQMSELTAALARATLEQACGLLADIPKLIRRWLAEREAVEGLAARPEWLLDGWERICLLWHVAEDTLGRPLALREVMNLLPMPPGEASGWTGIGIEARVEALVRRRRLAIGEDWRTGVTQADLIARNERLRALSPTGPG